MTTTTSIRIHPSAIVNSRAYLSTGSSSDKSPREKLHDIIENYRQLKYVASKRKCDENEFLHYSVGRSQYISLWLTLFVAEILLLFLDNILYSYSQETFSRFIKEVVKAADENKDGMISVVEVEHLLSNIGAHEALTPSEIKSIMEELGCADHVKGAKTPEEDTGIPASKVVDFFHLQPPKP